MVEASLVNIVQTVGILIGIAIALWQLRDIKETRETELETRQAQLFMYMYDRYNDPEYIRHFYAIREWEWTDYEDFMEKYGPIKNLDIYNHFRSIGSFLEGIGVLVKRKLVDPSLVDDLISISIISFWEKFGESIIKERQVRDNIPQFFEQVEYLYSVIKPIAESQHPELKT